MWFSLLWLTSIAHLVATIPTHSGFAFRSRNPAWLSGADLFSCPAASWPYADIGSLIQPQMADGELQSILAQVSPANIEATIRKLVSFGTRHTLSSQTDPNRGIGSARDWLASQFREAAAASNGQMTVEVKGYEQPADGDRVLFPIRISDVVATLKGTDDPGRVYIISGHYDTRCSDPNDYTSDAPGADDE